MRSTGVARWVRFLHYKTHTSFFIEKTKKFCYTELRKGVIKMFKWFSSLKKWEKSVFIVFILFVILLLSTIFIDFSRHKNFYQPFFYEEKEDYEKNMFNIEIIKSSKNME